MEFPFEIGRIFPGKITVIDIKDSSSVKIYDLESEYDDNPANNSNWIYYISGNASLDMQVKWKIEQLEIIIDSLGQASAKAQGLNSPVTTFKKFLNSHHQKIYTIRDLAEPRSVIGMLKVGIKRLFICDELGAQNEVDPICVLDFYIHESKQRSGFGHTLFNAMLQAEKISPEKLAIDRPTFKSLAFFQKHYELSSPLVQPNHYVIFPGFFNGQTVIEKSKCYSSKQNSSGSNFKNEFEALQSVQVPLSSKELQKNKTFSSSFSRNDDAGNGQIFKNQVQKPSNSSCDKFSSGKIKDSKKWGVREALHSYTVDSNNFNEWNASCSSPCSLTPVEDNMSKGVQRKWNSLQSSWNLFGVKPIDYTLYQKQS
ncbi:alpha-tubulin N-acetyltransferase 1-like isoform X2 [Stegodyphus dumicola]|uniref:alpha-tubulin N-acetyltransferase 1-like isoform X2 n=1 Tax=Stegodyphus dumicola TaxID=202533 RepID=UPI0015AEB3C7|nr:alpha-tubulin N-acetyltransferase 1-like isoform X2 [Stegodyphus dumicola]